MQTFQVKGIGCASCVGKITRAIERIDPAAGIQVDIEQGRVNVDSQATRENLAMAIEECGFDVVE